ncbi:hypothetical protein GA0070610_1828 [Micromonospora echinofusca]|uniref:Uncharacterized protein n=1 Tax=Micromonospora echinofusca TaxID=47858 RepID=A0A1C5G6P0_MICEH|nr:hypothetical protein [Micromonospora echinofusca]SCG15593.1 hypothetical protein GA0070610_1828 [Micromonospora echinofusca]
MSIQPRLDRDATITALQDQIDDLTATCEAQQRQLDAQQRLINQLATRMGLPLAGSAGR